MRGEIRNKTEFMYQKVLYKHSMAIQGRKKHPEQKVSGQCPGYYQTCQ